jgi:hypothetical protein
MKTGKTEDRRAKPLVARFHQLMNEPGRGEEGDGEAALISGEAER